MSQSSTPLDKLLLTTAPLLPLRDLVVFPHMVVELLVGRSKSVAALGEAMARDRKIVLATQLDSKIQDPGPEDIHRFGTLAAVSRLTKLPDGTIKAAMRGLRRVEVAEYLPEERFLWVRLEPIKEPNPEGPEAEALIRTVKTTFETYVKLNKRVPPDTLMSVAGIDDPSRLADTVASHIGLKLGQRQEVLELVDPKERLEKILELMQGEIEILELERKIRARVRQQMKRSQKEHYLNEQMQAIQKELGGGQDEFKSELQELQARIESKKLTPEARDRCMKELKKLRMMAPMSAEAAVVRNYLDWVLSLPWGEYSEVDLDMDRAERILDEDHYGLAKVKERILEFLAVQHLTGGNRGPILCFVGPPGVGKTSLGKSIARATGRRFVRLSLGGVRDEAEIRGHRRTYIGALPGKILNSLKKAGTGNPVFLLDELDKMSSDFRGDPAAAMLEVLDPEQNETFNDHYLDLDYDLSKVLFITTANSLHSIPAALRDRLEIIKLQGYTEFEKVQIALRYLIPKQKEANGIPDVDLTFTEEGLRKIICSYTREAGVRNLDREIASICRKVARRVVKEGKDIEVRVNARAVPKYLGVPRYKHGTADDKDEVGVTNGLAVTTAGGDLLTTEVTVMPGTGKLIITGKLGEVMQESARAAMSYVRSRAEAFGLEPDFYNKRDLHIHFPEGAIPKDGPSAGITMATSIVSALTGIPVRRDVAMTGEITLRGRVLQIGGLKAKLLAAHRGGMSKVLIPEDNQKDLKEIPRRVRRALTIVPVRHMDQVLTEALSRPPFEGREG